MKHLFLFAAIIVAFTSCRRLHGSGNIITEKKQVDNFKGISAGGAFEVELKTGPTTSVVIETDDNLMKQVQVRVSGDVLHIETKSNYSITDGHFKAYITAPEINSIKSSGAANIKAMDVLKSTGKIRFDASGAGNIKAEVDAPEIETEASGAGNIELTGRTRDYKADASGAGNIKTKNLQTENADIEASGAGNVHVHSSVSLKANASGAGNIYYNGGGTVSSKSSGAGNVKKED